MRYSPNLHHDTSRCAGERPAVRRRYGSSGEIYLAIKYPVSGGVPHWDRGRVGRGAGVVVDPII